MNRGFIFIILQIKKSGVTKIKLYLYDHITSKLKSQDFNLLLTLFRILYHFNID